jgi:hypothetical protein
VLLCHPRKAVDDDALWSVLAAMVFLVDDDGDDAWKAWTDGIEMNADSITIAADKTMPKLLEEIIVQYLDFITEEEVVSVFFGVNAVFQ